MRGVRLALICLGSAACVGGAAYAQEPRRGASPLDLPRRGYEPRGMRTGATVISPQLQVEAVYDSNVYALSEDPIDDLVVTILPSVQTDGTYGKFRLHTDLYAAVRKHVEQTRENAVSFGAGATGDYSISRAHSLTSELRYNREIESRTDPEARGGVSDPPRKIDIGLAEIGYRYAGSRIGIETTAAVQRYDYLSELEDDRDMTVYRGSVQGSVRFARVDAFAEAYVNQRDFDDSFDLSGVNRDAVTYGALLGFRRELSGKLRGRIGLGVFRSDPKDPTLDGFTGFAANGDLTWTPQPRTAVTLQLFRGDVATVRAGASGRTDTRVTLRVDQEARHNLVLSGAVSYRDTNFRGLANNSQTALSGEVEAEYLLNRGLSLFATARYTRRTADLERDEFDRAQAGIGFRMRY